MPGSLINALAPEFHFQLKQCKLYFGGFLSSCFGSQQNSSMNLRQSKITGSQSSEEVRASKLRPSESNAYRTASELNNFIVLKIMQHNVTSRAKKSAVQSSRTNSQAQSIYKYCYQSLITIV